MSRLVTDKSAVYKVKGKYLQYMVVYDSFDDTFCIEKSYNQKLTFVGRAYKTRKGAVRKYESLVNAIVEDSVPE